MSSRRSLGLQSPARCFEATYGETPTAISPAVASERAHPLLRAANLARHGGLHVVGFSRGSFSSRFAQLVGEPHRLP